MAKVRFRKGMHVSWSSVINIWAIGIYLFKPICMNTTVEKECRDLDCSLFGAIRKEGIHCWLYIHSPDNGANTCPRASSAIPSEASSGGMR
jgi:hypothetical protein